jgi:hypothetical protein
LKTFYGLARRICSTDVTVDLLAVVTRTQLKPWRS